MPAVAVPRTWFEGFAAELRRQRELHPEASPRDGGRNGSVLSFAIAEVARREGLKVNRVRSRWASMAGDHPDLMPDFMTDPNAGPLKPAEADAPASKGEAPPRTLDDDLALTRARQRATESSAKFRDAQAKILALQEELAAYKALEGINPRPAQWTLAPRGGEGSEHIPYLLTSDFQVGEVIRPQETDASHGYDIATFRRRYRALIETTIALCHDHAGTWRFPGIIYARGGDTISGAIHDELAQTDEVTPIEAVKIAFEEESAGIQKLLDAFGRVEIKDAGGGNHDRITHKPQSKRATALSYDSLVSYMLRREFMRDERVTFQGTESPDVYFSIYGTRILLTHGDKIGSRGGMGMVGPAATISRGAQKVIVEQQRLGRAVDEVHMGHFHSWLDLVFAFCNGCLPGYSEYAKMNRLMPAPPSQALMFYHPVYGRVDVKKIVLERPLAA